MTVDELLHKHGIKLANTRPGRHYTTCPKCSATRTSNEHRAAKCSASRSRLTAPCVGAAITAVRPARQRRAP